MGRILFERSKACGNGVIDVVSSYDKSSLDKIVAAFEPPVRPYCDFWLEGFAGSNWVSLSF